MPAPQLIRDLVARFHEHQDSYRAETYSEAQLRQEFLNPFFEALGWDIYNRQGYAEAYKDVVHEDSIKIGGATRAPDYCFRIGGSRKFFVEAKKPAVNLSQDVAPAYQLRRYAWSAKLPLSILTDFEELAVYDCRVRPEHNDAASKARTLYLTCEQYEDRWDEIAAVFSREAVLKGAFDKYAESSKKKRGTAEVDIAFLAEIEEWRSQLARNLALRNPELSQREVNTAVQKTIDRIVFLRICEDRGIEIYGRLQALQNGPKTYARLCELFREADDRYNSGLFHFSAETGRHEAPDAWTLSLNLDDTILKDIVRNLYYPDSPYEFSVIGAEILGQVYEQFLGKVIRLTAGHRAVVEDKPEVKKAGGVYDTPTYIVAYIVKNTVGKLLEGKTPQQIRGTKKQPPLSILDPACGSGSFLIGAYQYLLNWYRDWYVEHGPDKHTKSVYQTDKAQWRLTTTERKRILLDHIYGVDIDPQAVEVTKLSLLLKVLEAENKESLELQRRFFHERALPDLGDNIKCGNSLIGPDFYIGQQLSLIDTDERLRVNVFDWSIEFRRTIGGGGFDAVIGNPPYVRQESLGEIKSYLKRQYKSFESTADLYVYFVEKSIGLLREGGFFSFIVSSSFLRTNFGRGLRSFVQQSAAVLELVDFGGLPVFSAAKDTYVCIPLISKRRQPKSVRVCKVDTLEGLDLPKCVKSRAYRIPMGRLSREAWVTDHESLSATFERLRTGTISLGKHLRGRIFRGIITGLNEAFEIDVATRGELIDACPNAAAVIRPFLGGQDIRRYSIRQSERYLIAIPNGWTRKHLSESATRKEREAWDWFASEYPPLAAHLAPFAEAARKRQDQGEFWWELRPCDYYDVLDGPKIVYPDIAKHARFYLDTEGIYIRNTAYCLGSDDKYLLGVLNSRLAWFAIARISIPFGERAGEYRYRLFTQYIEQLPIYVVDGSDHGDLTRRDRVEKRVDQMLAFQRELAAVKISHERTALERQISAVDHEIDRLVYELYRLTDEEIRIVEEEATPR
ncbi:MAG: Eco57I restriction-modification methylase domain-containing protein [Planctomycetota bacterium]|nr:Eco57I restriction-modification methylase domain-containing protein [Planctomycetota bacterium]